MLDNISAKNLASHLLPCLNFPFLSLPVFDLKCSVFTPVVYQTAVQFDPNLDHLFSSNQGPAIGSEQWENTHVILSNFGLETKLNRLGVNRSRWISQTFN